MKPILVFMTDFTYLEGAVCSMYGVVKSVDRSLEIIDGTHELPQYDCWSASYRLNQCMRFWPEGTIFVCVVDPGVGTSRRACVAKTCDGYFVVTPDNGSLTHIKAFSGIREVREIDQSVNRLKIKGTESVNIFHGRDVFGYCAARLASGIITYEQVGPVYSADEIVTFEMKQPKISGNEIAGIFEINDPNFGNLWTNVPYDKFVNMFQYGSRPLVRVTHSGDQVFLKRVRFCISYGEAARGEPLIYNNELNRIAMAVSRGSLARDFELGYGDAWEVSFTI
jgi:S-adenosylmethionine hydrolase